MNAVGAAPEASHADAAPARPHLLDASTFWTPDGVGGVHRVLCTKQGWLSAQGWRHTLLAPGADGPGRLDCGGVRIPGSGGYRFVFGRGRAARPIEQAQPDIVEAADPYTLGWAVLDATAHLAVPAVAFCHSNLPALARRLLGGVDAGDSLRVRWAMRRARVYLARLYTRFDMVLAPSRSMTQQLQHWGVHEALHQPLGVDCSVFSPQANDPAWRLRLDSRLGLTPDTRLLVYAGRFGPEKNLDLLVEAVRRLGAGHALLALGSGPQSPAGEHVRVLPPEPDRRRLARLLASCDPFVHAGDQETFGLAALEAMACGTPLVVNTAGGLGELADGVVLSLNSRRPAAWTEAMAASLSEHGAALAQRALERARAHDWELVLGQLSRRYLQAMRTRRPAAAASRLAPRAAALHS